MPRSLHPCSPAQAKVLSPAALDFLEQLHRRFEQRRQGLLQRRRQRQRQLDTGVRPDFLDATRAVRAADWKVADLPADLLDRRVEITGPVDRKMIINALNSGASTFMADFEDSSSPTWDNMLVGQINLRDAVRRTISFDDPQRGKHYALDDDTAVLLVRPRGWHLDEEHLRIDEQPIAASLFDFGLYFFHNARALIDAGTGPYFYLAKLESHLEARLWNDVFIWAQDQLGIPTGTIKATVLIETILAAFEMDEILWELRPHAAGLNCGRWDYIFSFIKKFARHPEFVLPDREQVGMTRHFLHSYSRLLIRTCHRRGAHAMGGMAAQIPIKGDAAANDIALGKVRADKKREVHDGHDGTWVAHPALVPVAREIFDAAMPEANQLDRELPPMLMTSHDLLRVPRGSITLEGLRHNINVGLLYLEAWLQGSGCVPLYDLMEDAATAEICRAQLWQWAHHQATLQDGRIITRELVLGLLDEEMRTLRRGRPADDACKALVNAAGLFRDMITQEEFCEFLTLPAYRELLSDDRQDGTDLQKAS
jgi:malate synthase